MLIGGDFTHDNWVSLADLPMLQEKEFVSQGGDRQTWLFTLDREESIPELIGRLAAGGARIYQVLRKEPHLEDVFLHWVNRKEAERHVDDRQPGL